MKTFQEHFGITDTQKEQIIQGFAEQYRNHVNVNSVGMTREAMRNLWDASFQDGDDVRLTYNVPCALESLLLLIGNNARNHDYTFILPKEK